MRARMSDAPRRLDPDIFGCGSREMSERVAGIYAINEARSILADAEPGDRGIFRSVRFLNAESGRMWAMEFLDERLALVESLRSFVEGN